MSTVTGLVFLLVTHPFHWVKFEAAAGWRCDSQHPEKGNIKEYEAQTVSCQGFSGLGRSRFLP